MSLSDLGPEAIASRLYPSRAVHRPLPDPSAWAERHVDEYRQQGFVAVANVFDPQEVQAAREGLSRMIAGDSPGFHGIQYEDDAKGRELHPERREPFVRKLFDFTPHDERLAVMATKPVFLSVVRSLLGSDVSMSQEMALLKPPHIGREKPWHQDMAYFLLDPPEGVLGTWIALDEATPENGCMHVIPGSHLEGPMPHYHDRDCQIADEEVQVERDVLVPLAPGGVLFFSGLLHHGTPPNRSPFRRWALQFHYKSIRCKKVDPAVHERLFFDRLGYAGCTGHLTGTPYRPIEQKPV